MYNNRRLTFVKAGVCDDVDTPPPAPPPDVSTINIESGTWRWYWWDDGIEEEEDDDGDDDDEEDDLLPLFKIIAALPNAGFSEFKSGTDNNKSQPNPNSTKTQP